MGSMKLGRPRRYDLPYSQISESDRRRINREMRFHADVNIPGDRTRNLPTPIAAAILVIFVAILAGAYRQGWFEPVQRGLQSVGIMRLFDGGSGRAVEVCKSVVRVRAGVTREERPSDFISAADGVNEADGVETWRGWFDSGGESVRFTCSYSSANGTAAVAFGF